MAQKICPRDKDYGRWYTDIVQMAELADYSPVRGCMVIRPNGYSIWEKIQQELDKRLKATGHKNLYFPLFVPESFLKKEAEHVEGFAPECAVVTHAGGKQLEEPLVIRPTSETVIWHMYKQWIHSWRDLPLLYNQWANVVRWEMRTRLFLRTTEFLWQEGHTAHANEEEARKEALLVHQLYKKLIEEVMAIPVVCGKKTQQEKFPGAVDTYTLEGLMQEGKALQMGTSHYLGQTFSKAFEVTFQNKEGELEFPYATSWGVTTRLIGALIMTHSDDQGLIIPPKLAETPLVIVPIWRGEEEKKAIKEFVTNLPFDGIAFHFDDREEEKPGYKFNEWELKGIPLRLEVGPRDLAKGEVVLARRDTGEKCATSIATLRQTVEKMLDDIQTNLFRRAQERVKKNSHFVDTYTAFQEKLEEGGFLYAHWCGNGSCEQKISEETKASIRVLPFDAHEEAGACIYCKEPSSRRAVFARAY
ncbi:MAG: proline--tRNA ligase [Verrucomicrobia bacterium]|nr:proline--tRNA ligase [Verrucomicrobiota bacterium]